MKVPDEVLELLRPSNEGPTLVVTLGNSLRGDDGVGPWIAARAASRAGLSVWDAGERPEEMIDRASALGARRVVILDAADFGGLPGEIRLLPPESLVHAALSTHTFPVSAIARLVELDTGSRVFFVGVQAASARPGEGLGAEVRASGEEILDALAGASAD